MTRSIENPERRQKSRLDDDDERIWRGQLVWTFLVAIGVAVVALQHVASTQAPAPQEDHGPGRFLSSTLQ